VSFLKKTKKETVKNISISTEKDNPSDWLNAEGELVVDVYQTDLDFCIRSPIAGVNPEDVDILIEKDMLLIKGERKEPEAEVKKDYSYKECYWGPFLKKIILPENSDNSRAKATFTKGVLIIKIPIVKKVERKKIAVETKK